MFDIFFLKVNDEAHMSCNRHSSFVGNRHFRGRNYNEEQRKKKIPTNQLGIFLLVITREYLENTTMLTLHHVSLHKREKLHGWGIVIKNNILQNSKRKKPYKIMTHGSLSFRSAANEKREKHVFIHCGSDSRHIIVNPPLLFGT